MPEHGTFFRNQLVTTEQKKGGDFYCEAEKGSGVLKKMIASVDVHYLEKGARVACVLFQAWSDDKPAYEVVTEVGEVKPYVSGQFFRRELPCLLAVLRALDEPPRVIIIDGYVWLGDERRPGLGAYLYEALGRQAPVIGVAKTEFHGARLAHPIVRGGSISPLYVSAAGMDLSDAAHYIHAMHGKFRIPTLLRRADQLSRGAVATAARRDGSFAEERA